MSLSVQKRWEIVFLSTHKYGPKWSKSKIAKYLKVDTQTVSRWLKRYEETGDVLDFQKSGAARKTNKKQDKVLLKFIEKNPEATVAQIQNFLNEKNINLSKTTIQRRLKQSGYKAKGPKSVPLLTDTHIAKRFEWAERHNEVDWNKVIFTDECTFIMENRQKKFWVKDQEQFVVKKVKHPLKVHAWGCFSRQGFGKLILFTKNLDADFMCEIYKTGLLPSAKDMFGPDSNNWILQEDNDPKHRSRKCVEFKTENNVSVLPWPSMSPDINPIENVWGIMKMKIAGKPKTTLKSFKKQLTSTWRNLPVSLAEKLVDTMPTRINTLKLRNGDYIGY